MNNRHFNAGENWQIKYQGGKKLPAVHVNNAQNILQQPKLQLIIFFTTGCEGWGGIHFNQPAEINKSTS